MNRNKTYALVIETSEVNGVANIEKWAIKKIDSDDYQAGLGGQSLINFLYGLPNNSKVFMPDMNLGGYFLTNILFNEGIVYEDYETFNTKERDISFNTVISSKNDWYNINIRKNGKTLTICNLDIKIELGSSDMIYTFLNGKESEEMEDYINAISKALEISFDKGLTYNTASKDAEMAFKKTLGSDYKTSNKTYKLKFPKLEDEVDSNIRKAYNSAFVYKNPDKTNVGKGFVIDANSFYPDIAKNELLPVGRPVITDHYVEKDLNHYCVFYEIEADLTLKYEHLPSLANSTNLSNNLFIDECIIAKSSKNNTLWVTSHDLEIIKNNYEIDDLNVLQQYTFRGERGIAENFINRFFDEKQEAENLGQMGSRFMAKLMMNSLIGGFGKKKRIDCKVPNYKNGMTNLDFGVSTYSPNSYSPFVVFVTSIARRKIVEFAQANYDKFIYADSDSLHLEGNIEDLVFVDDVKLDDTELGAWKVEHIFEEGKYLKLKTYAISCNGYDKITAAGVNSYGKSYMSYDSFEEGATIPYGKTVIIPVVGGAVRKHLNVIL